MGIEIPSPRQQIAATTQSANSLRQTVHTHRASVHQAAKLVAALLRVARITAGLRKVMAAYRRVYGSRHVQADCQEPRSAQEPYARQSRMGYRLRHRHQAVASLHHDMTTANSTPIHRFPSVAYRECAVTDSWWRGTVVERRSLAGELSLSCARPAADG